jgi:RimJ/RimL family protein N-acetyltransferase
MSFDYQPTLKGRLLELRPLRWDDYDALYAVASDPLIWEQHPERARHRPGVFRKFFDGAVRSGGALTALDAATGEVIGSSRFFGFDEAAGEVEIGWTFLARKYWGGRYNGEMKELMMRHAFRFASSVVFLIGPNNMRSRRAVEKIGGVLTGTTFRDGRESVVYTISRPHVRTE